MPNQNADMAAMIVKVCGGVAAPWRKKITAAGSADGASCGHGGADRFSNPRGFIIEDTIDRIISGIAGSCGRGGMKAAMETFMKIQALEAPSPEAAVDFLQQLIYLVRESAVRSGESSRSEAARAVEKSIDEWIIVAIEMYNENRALLPCLRAQEKRRTEIRILKKNSRTDQTGREAHQ